MNKTHYTYLYLKRFGVGLTACLFAFSPVLPLWASESKSTPAKKTQHTDKNTPKPVDNYPRLVIGPGDILNIEVYGENGMISTGGGSSSTGVSNQLPTEYQVDTDGLIYFPFIGRLHLEGLTPAEASEKIAVLLSKPRKVTVLIKESNTYWISVLGNVGRPGRYQIVGHPTLLSSLAEAGGPLPGTDMGGAILIHNNMKTKVDLNKYLSGDGKMDPEPYFYPGDTLMVQKSPWPSIGEIAIVASILASAAVVTVELSNLRK